MIQSVQRKDFRDPKQVKQLWDLWKSEELKSNLEHENSISYRKGIYGDSEKRLSRCALKSDEKLKTERLKRKLSLSSLEMSCCCRSDNQNLLDFKSLMNGKRPMTSRCMTTTKGASEAATGNVTPLNSSFVCQH